MAAQNKKTRLTISAVRLVAKKRNDLSLTTSSMIQKQKEFTLKQLNSNSLFARTFNSSNFFLKLNQEGRYLIFVRVLAKAGSNSNFMAGVCASGIEFVKADNLKKDRNYGDFIKSNGWFAKLVQTDSLYLLSTNKLDCYLDALKKCFILEAAEKSDEYFSFNVLYAREADIFINFSEASSYDEIRQLYNKQLSQSNILLEFNEILRSNAVSASNGVSTELMRVSNLLYPYVF